VVLLLYYRLIADIGPTKALPITFLMPAFTMIWAALFQGQDITAPMMIGCALILGGTALAQLSQLAAK
jgi:drug/metabolite transporter (DMT)-like permease